MRSVSWARRSGSRTGLGGGQTRSPPRCPCDPPLIFPTDPHQGSAPVSARCEPEPYRDRSSRGQRSAGSSGSSGGIDPHESPRHRGRGGGRRALAAFTRSLQYHRQHSRYRRRTRMIARCHWRLLFPFRSLLFSPPGGCLGPRARRPDGVKCCNLGLSLSDLDEPSGRRLREGRLTTTPALNRGAVVPEAARAVVNPGATGEVPGTAGQPAGDSAPRESRGSRPGKTQSRARK
jgi:hypothetical protein